MAGSIARGVFIVAAKRTPFGSFGGKLTGLSGTELSAAANKAVLEASKIDPQNVDSVVIGNVNQTSTDAIYLARHAALRAGIPIPVPALTVNRQCGSGFQSIINGAQEVDLGVSDIVLTGGTESMSQSPFVARNIRYGIPFGTQPKLEDKLWSGLTDDYANMQMAETAEKLGEQYGITREQCDEFALTSQQRWANAHKNGYFSSEIFSMEIKGKKGPEKFDTDEHPRETTLEKLQKLEPVFKENGLVTAGNASGICDGASAIIVASEKALVKHNLTPLARLVGYGLAGVDPTIMGIGPAYAIRNLLSITSMTMENIDLFEVNEAFAAQFLAVEKELGLDRSKTNINGGAIALGHPLGASGSRIIGHLAYELKRTGKKYAIGSACIGGGQGIALLLENIQ